MATPINVSNFPFPFSHFLAELNAMVFFFLTQFVQVIFKQRILPVAIPM
jgi:hypothetical protein